MTFLADLDPDVNFEPSPLDADHEHTAVPATHWISGRIAWHALESREDGDIHDMIATDLNDILCLLRDYRLDSATALVAMPGHRFSGVDLDSVAIPEDRESHAADLLDEAAAAYLDLGGALARLAAVAIFRRADEIESMGVQILREYWAAVERRERQRGEDRP